MACKCDGGPAIASSVRHQGLAVNGHLVEMMADIAPQL
jgi:hypothetical protein